MPPISAFAAYKNTLKTKDKKKSKPNKQKKDKLKSVQNDKKRFKASNVKKTFQKFQNNKNQHSDSDLEENEVFSDSNISLGSAAENFNEISKEAEPQCTSPKQFKQSADKKEPNAASTAKKANKSTSHYNEKNLIEKIVDAAPKELKTRPVSKTPVLKPKTTNPLVKSNSILDGEKAFQWLISPMEIDKFFHKYWEQNALLVKRDNLKLYQTLISFKSIDKMLLNNHVEFTKNIDVTSYENGVRETHNPEGRALPSAVWDFYSDGCSIRLLNPQTFLKPLYELCATMQEYFHCLVGVNAYLTPPKSQGFAPHYDDIEAFVLQVEGRKRWKLYKPRTPAEDLPRYSSPNFSQDEIGEPILEEVLEPGDLLYFPRGTIHQACTEPGFHSLHITLSVYQKQSYADLLEKMMPKILKNAIASNVNLRRGLPLNIWRNAGLVFNDLGTQERAKVEEKVEKVVRECFKSFDLTKVMDAAVDDLAKKFQHEALPPNISQEEQPHTVFGIRNEVDENGDCLPNCPVDLRTNIRLLRANILRLVNEEGQFHIYYYLDNSKEYCQYEPNFFEIEPELASSVEILIKSYPEYIGVSQLPLEDDESKIDLAVVMWKRGLLMTEKP